MELFQNEPVVKGITAAVFVPAGSGAPVHKNRKAHGLAFNVSHTTVYRFENGKVLTCQSGDCIYLPQGVSYTVDRSQPSQLPQAGVYAINFYLEAPIAPEPLLLHPRSQDTLRGAFSKAEHAWRQKQPGFRQGCMSELYRIFQCLLREQTGYTRRDKALAVLTPALTYINENYTRGLQLQELAKLCRVSQPYLRRLFHGAFGEAPAVYVRNLRLRYARELLGSGEYSVSEVAGLSGFNDAAYFSREFKRATGLTPSQYSRKTSEK